MAPHKLEADGIQLEFGFRRILSDIYLLCETGKITGLLGRNGQGKTCLMNIIYGSLQAESKSIRFDNQSFPQAFKRPELLMYLPQFNFIPGSLNLKRLFLDFHLSFGDFEKWFPEFSGKYRSLLKDLSGGQRRLTEVYLVARSSSRFAMLDEPFSHLMPIHIETMTEILAEEKQHKGILVTDHLYQPIVNCADRIYVLTNGKTHLARKMEDLDSLGYIKL
jgi:ABC-type multidrug transport system ATPase subunit